MSTNLNELKSNFRNGNWHATTTAKVQVLSLTNDDKPDCRDVASKSRNCEIYWHRSTLHGLADHNLLDLMFLNCVV